MNNQRREEHIERGALRITHPSNSKPRTLESKNQTVDSFTSPTKNRGVITRS